jgi:hypothetical protein
VTGRRRPLRRGLTASTLLVLGALVVPTVAPAATHHVSPTGSDDNPGTVTAPWRTVARVNDARLSPGDTVAFEGGATFDGELAPSHSGVAGSPVTFTSYGAGRATLTGGVFLHDVAHQALRSLRIVGAAQGVLGSRDGLVTDVLIDDVVIADAIVGVNSASPANARWTLANSTVAFTRDSGVILEGADMTVRDTTITDTGRGWATLRHNVHGIYSKSPRLSVLRTVIGPNRDPEGEGISTRFRDALIDGNRIHDVAYAIGYYNDDPTAAYGAGTTTVRRNIAWRLSAGGLYVDPGGNAGRGMPENWRIHNNTWLGSGDVALDLQPGGTRIAIRNNAAGGFGALLRVQAGPRYVHDHNLTVPFLVFGPGPGVAGLIGPALVDAGTVVVDDGVVLTASCDGGPAHFCGAAPDIGAIESLPAAP